MIKTMVMTAVLMVTGAALGQTQEPAGCVEATAHTSGPCKLIYPSGLTITTGADKRTWVKLPAKYDNFKFEVAGLGYATGAFGTTIVAKLPQAPDVVQAPQMEMLSIQGDCQSKTYQVQGAMATDVNGIFSEDLGSESFARKALPGTPMEVVFGMICKSN